MKSLKTIQTEIGEWAKIQFGDNISKDKSHPTCGMPLGSLAPLLGMGEEYGELLHPILYRLQGRGCEGEEGRVMIKDALADLMVFMCDFASRESIDLEATLNTVWEKVSKRTREKWIQDKQNEKCGLEAKPGNGDIAARNDSQLVDCPRCEGKGQTMFGSLASVCAVCEGRKKVSVDVAAVAKAVDGPKVNEQVVCPRCNGAGSHTFNGPLTKCAICEGTGNVDTEMRDKVLSADALAG